VSNAFQPQVPSNGAAFVAKLNSAGSDAFYATYLGGSTGGSTALSIAANGVGEAYVVGTTFASDFPVLNPLPSTNDDGGCPPPSCSAAFITKFTASGGLAYSTLFGGTDPSTAFGVALGSGGNAVVTGSWRIGPVTTFVGPSPGNSPQYPVFPLVGSLEIGAGKGVYMIQLSDAVTQYPTYTRASITNGASFVFGLAPGGIGTVFGTNLTTANGIVTAQSLPLPASLDGTSVSINGQTAPLFAVANVNGQQQINFQVPDSSQVPEDSVVTVTNNGVQGFPVAAATLQFRPGVFTIDGIHGAVEHASGQLVTPLNPAAKGEVVVIFATGLGASSPDPGTGNPASSSQLSMTVTTPTVTVAGLQASVQFSGLAPGFVGLNQINVQLPANLASGDQDLIITMQSSSTSPQSSPAVKLSVQ
jgi:uncharacterized protein (TIGR03437 family)